MNWLKSTLTELVGLFVDDGLYAIAIVAWLLVTWLLISRFDLSPVVGAVVLFGGLVLILVESATRRAREG
jgi:hypothetical protein